MDESQEISFSKSVSIWITLLQSLWRLVCDTLENINLLSSFVNHFFNIYA